MRSIRLATSAVALFAAAPIASSQQRAPAPADVGGSGAPAPAAKPKDVAKESANDADAKAAAPKLLDENHILAAVDDEVVTIRDVMTAWRLDNRHVADPDRSALPKPEQQMRIAKELVMDRLWLAHAKQHPMWELNVKPRLIEDVAKDVWSTQFTDPSVPPDEHDLMRFQAESLIARDFSLRVDSEYQRVSVARPDDVRRVLELHPEKRHQPTSVQLGRVSLGKELYGDKVDALVKQIRQRAAELSSLEAAAKELAPGSFVAMKECNVEQNDGLRDDVLAFARKAEAGELSAPVNGTASVMLFTVLARHEGRDVPFEEAAANLKDQIERGRKQMRSQQFFVDEILPNAFFVPPDLFDDEIELVRPGTREWRARAAAAAARAHAATAPASSAKK